MKDGAAVGATDGVPDRFAALPGGERGRVIRGSLTLLCMRMAQRSLGLVSTLLLARLLVPADFAVVAVAMIVLHLLEVIGDTGARQYLVQRRSMDDAAIDTAWTLDLIFRAASVGVLLACLPFVAAVWENPAITLVTAALAPTLLAGALRNPLLHVDVRNTDFSRIFRVELTQKVVGLIAVVSAAYVFRSYWAMVVGTWCAVIAGVVSSHLLCRRIPRPCISELRTQWHFSKWIVGRGFIGYLRGQADMILASRFLAPGMFGQYVLARELSVLPASDVVGPMLQPMFSSFARVRDVPGELVRQLAIATLVLSLAIAPITVFLTREGVAVARIVLGPQWVEAGPMLCALAPLLLIYSIGQMTNYLLLARGAVRTLFLTDTGSFIIIVACLWVVRDQGAITFIHTRTWIGLVLTLGMFLYFAYCAGLRVGSSLVTLVPPAVAAILAAIAMQVVLPVPVFEVLLADFLLRGVVFLSAYAVAAAGTCAILRARSASWHYVGSLAASTVTRAAAQAVKTADAAWKSF